ncbi:MAG: hypothetical protein IKO83_04945 [Oscillospiraceae bacterium]|nr:hypothetical protein [Oscillospiraceae bacterium]
MIIILIIATIAGLKALCRPAPRKVTVTRARTAPSVSPTQIEQQQRARAEEEAARDLARMELDHIEAQRAQLMALCDELEAEKGGATPARRNTITRQIISLEDRLYKLDIKRAKAYSAAYAA